jgi:hypothetical protein
MRLPYTKKLLLNNVYSKEIIIYGRLKRGEFHIMNLFNPCRYYRLTYTPAVEDFQGWIHLEVCQHVVFKIIKQIPHDIVYVYSLLNGLYTIYIIRKREPFESLCKREYYYNIEKSSILPIIGINYNGYIYYNKVFDKDHSMLNEFRLAFNPSFSLNLAKN